MSFDHMEVSTLLEQHAWVCNFIQTRGVSDEDRQRVFSTHAREMDGIPMPRELAEFCAEIRKTARDVKFAMERGGKRSSHEGAFVADEVWAYYPEDQYAFMRVGYADYSVRGSADSKYAVYSRNIKNEKFNRSREQYYMVLADTLPRAVKNANKHMRRYGVIEIAEMSLDHIKTRLSRVSRQVDTAYIAAREAVVEHGSFFSEMRSLAMSNYQFNDSTFNAAVKNMVEKFDEYTAKQHKQQHGYYVQARQYLGEQVFDVLPVTDIHKSKSKLMTPHTGLRAEELVGLDENLPNRLAALSMLEDGGFVEDLGQKISGVSYWVLHA